MLSRNVWNEIDKIRIYERKQKKIDLLKKGSCEIKLTYE